MVFYNLIIENILQNFNDRYVNKSCATNNECDMFQAGEILAMKSGGTRLY